MTKVQRPVHSSVLRTPITVVTTVLGKSGRLGWLQVDSQRYSIDKPHLEPLRSGVQHTVRKKQRRLPIKQRWLFLKYSKEWYGYSEWVVW